MTSTSKTATRWLWLGALVIIWWLAGSELTGSAITKDAGENLQMALNLERHGVMSDDAAPPYQPSMLREPVPIGVLALAIYASDRLLGPVAITDYFSGARARDLKFLNLLWLTLLASVTFMATRHFTSSTVVAVVGGLLVALHFTWFVPMEFRRTLGVDNLDTELAGAALLAAASLLFALGLTRRHRLQIVAAGICFGLAALTKGALFYVCLAGIGALAVYCAIAAIRRRTATVAGLNLGAIGALAAPFLLITLCWMSRNLIQTGYFQIAERSGSVLMHRAFMDDATPEEFRGMFAVWGEPHLSKLIGRLLGFSTADLAPGGRLQRVSEGFSGPAQEHEIWAEENGVPEQATTWYRKARALYEQKRLQFAQQGYRYPSGAADRATRNEAVALIRQKPFKHAAVMIPLLWRSTTPVTLPALVAACLYGWRRARPDLLLYALPALGLALFYAAASQFAPRFGYVIDPIAIVALLTLCAVAGSVPRRADDAAPEAPALP